MRFNGKSNQQNYLNYDGVDGTYVWDASPGYLNATGSQFRLQTSMESVAEFRVNSGLAPAESGLGAGGNITVVSKSGSNQLRGSLFEYKRDDALDAASKYDDMKQPLELISSAARSAARSSRNKTFFFASYEGLRQKTGLSFTEAVPSDEARRRILAGEPVGSGAGQSAGAHAGGGAAAGRLPARHGADREPAASRWRRSATDGRAGREHAVAARSITASATRSRSTSAISTARATSTRRIARSRRAACWPSSSRRTSSVNHQSHRRAQHGQRVQGRLQPAEDQRAWRSAPSPATTRSACRCPARSPRRRSTRAARPASRAAAC